MADNLKLPSRNYVEGFKARNEALWDKIKNNTFVNMVFPIKEVSEGNTEAVLPLVVPGGNAVRTTYHALKPVSRSVKQGLSPVAEINALPVSEQIKVLGRPVITENKPVIKAGTKEFKKILNRDPQVPVRNNPEGLTYRLGADKTEFTIEGDEYFSVPKIRRDVAKQYSLDPYLSQYFGGRPIEASTNGLYGVNFGDGTNPSYDKWLYLTEPLLIQLRDKLMSGAIKTKRLGGTIDYFKFFN